MSFSILDHLDKINKNDKRDGKYICPACGGNNFDVNKRTGAYNCFDDPSAAHRAEIRNVVAPLVRWEKPSRERGSHDFEYYNRDNIKSVIVHRQDTDKGKRIWQDFPTLEKSATDHKTQLQEIKSKLLPFMYHEAIEKSQETGCPIFIVEGELTCQLVWALDIPCVTFLGGSKQYRTNADYSELFKDQKIVLCPDRDEQGVSFMHEVEKDNPGAQWFYADPKSWEWESLPTSNGYDLGDYIEEEGVTKDEILATIVTKSRHKGNDGKASYDEMLSAVEGFIGNSPGDTMRTFIQTSDWLESHGRKPSATLVEALIEEAKEKVHGAENVDSIDALDIVRTDKCREWLIAGILPLGSVMLLAAAGGTGKSTVAYNWALKIAKGERWSKRRCLQGKSLIIQSDEPIVDTQEKLEIIGYKHADLKAGDITFWENWRFHHMHQLENFIRRERPRFICIDSLTACLAGTGVDLVKSNAGDVIYGLRDLANQYGCTIVILHHLNKSGGLRDSTSFVDNVSEVVKLIKNEHGAPDEFIFEWLKSRSGLIGKHLLSRKAADYSWTYDGALGASTSFLDRVVNAIDHRKLERFDKHQVASLLNSTEFNAVGSALEVARRQGLIGYSYADRGRTKVMMYQSWDFVPTDEDLFCDEEEDQGSQESHESSLFDDF